MKTLIKLLVITLAVLAFAGCDPNYSSSEMQERGARAATPDEQRALGIRTDTEENQMSQTGTSDVQIDPATRAQYDRDHP